jgi:hypothetical protein
MNNTELLKEQLANDLLDNAKEVKLLFDTKKRFNKKKKLSGLDIATAVYVSFKAANSFVKTWEDGKLLINELQKPEPMLVQNNAVLLWQAMNNPFYLHEHFGLLSNITINTSSLQLTDTLQGK